MLTLAEMKAELDEVAFQEIKRYLIRVLDSAAWNQGKAAKIAGVHYTSFSKMLLKYGIRDYVWSSKKLKPLNSEPSV